MTDFWIKTDCNLMKILQIGKFYPIRGGVEKVMYDLTEGISERGIRCDMLCASSDMESKEIELNPYGRVICCRSLMKLAATMISPSMISRLHRIHKEYDIIHIHHPDPMACIALFMSGYKGKVVLHWHSDIIKQKRLLRIYTPMQDWLIRRADMIIGTSPVYIENSPYLKDVQEKTEYLPIGVSQIHPDADKVKALKARYPGKRIVYSLGRLVGYKGYEHLIKAAGYLPDDFVVLIGGEGPLKEKLAAQIEGSGLSGKVFLLGRISDRDFPNYYGACDVFCLSSVSKAEAFAIVQIEAMSCGRPVVATEIPGSGVSWVNSHGISGLNVRHSDASKLAEAIKEITSGENTYAGYSERALKRYEELFTFDRMIDNCINKYEKL